MPYFLRGILPHMVQILSCVCYFCCSHKQENMSEVFIFLHLTPFSIVHKLQWFSWNLQNSRHIHKQKSIIPDDKWQAIYSLKTTTNKTNIMHFCVNPKDKKQYKSNSKLKCGLLLIFLFYTDFNISLYVTNTTWMILYGKLLE